MTIKASELTSDVRNVAINVLCLKEMQRRARRSSPRWYYLSNRIDAGYKVLDEMGAPSLETIIWGE